jgi:hypothetical protein
MKLLLKFLLGFLAITGAVALLSPVFGMQFGSANYWDVHGFIFLLFITIFPRLTLLLSSVATGGVFWWLGWIFSPRILVAVLATFSYWHQNKFLVISSWLIALGGESSEKYAVVRQTRWGSSEPKWVESEVVK